MLLPDKSAAPSVRKCWSKSPNGTLCSKASMGRGTTRAKILETICWSSRRLISAEIEVVEFSDKGCDQSGAISWSVSPPKTVESSRRWDMRHDALSRHPPFYG